MRRKGKSLNVLLELQGVTLILPKLLKNIEDDDIERQQDFL